MAQSLPHLSSVQLDTPFANGKFYSLPKHLPGRVNTDDFVFFSFPENMNPNDYMVAVDTLDTSDPSCTIRTIGPLRENVELPFVVFDAYASIYVIPQSDPTKHTYYARLSRGSSYKIPAIKGIHRIGVKHEMARTGVLSSGADSSNLAY
jgi:hypothetical protein